MPNHTFTHKLNQYLAEKMNDTSMLLEFSKLAKRYQSGFLLCQKLPFDQFEMFLIFIEDKERVKFSEDLGIYQNAQLGGVHLTSFTLKDEDALSDEKSHYFIPVSELVIPELPIPSFAELINLPTLASVPIDELIEAIQDDFTFLYDVQIDGTELPHITIDVIASADGEHDEVSDLLRLNYRDNTIALIKREGRTGRIEHSIAIFNHEKYMKMIGEITALSNKESAQNHLLEDSSDDFAFLRNQLITNT